MTAESGCRCGECPRRAGCHRWALEDFTADLTVTPFPVLEDLEVRLSDLEVRLSDLVVDLGELA